MFGNMMGKLEEAKRKAEEVKARMDHIQVEGKSGGVIATVTANRVVKRIEIPDTEMSKEDMEFHIAMAMNTALDQATKIQEAEMAAVAQEAMPNIPGMGNLFKK